MDETLKFVLNAERQEQIKQLMVEGYTQQCLGCGMVYKTKPQSFYEDGHGGRDITYCKHCDSDLFIPLKERYEKCFNLINIPMKNTDGTFTNIFKEHNFKHCTCNYENQNYKVHTGAAEDECGALFQRFEEISRCENNIRVKCPRSGWHVIILKDNLKEREQREKEYFISPLMEDF